MIRRATQQEINDFYSRNILNERIYPFQSTSQYNSIPSVENDDYNSIHLTNEKATGVMHININRVMSNEITISVYAETGFVAGKLLKMGMELCKRYNPKSIVTCVHESNELSLRINRKIFGKEWGVEPMGAWNFKKAEFENLHWFKKIMY